jgi:hypothetical protein
MGLPYDGNFSVTVVFGYLSVHDNLVLARVAKQTANLNNNLQMQFVFLCTNNMKILYPLIGLILFGCSPRIHTSVKNDSRKPLNADARVLVVDVRHLPPDSCALIGTLKINNSVFLTDCGYDDLINDAQAAVRKAGGNVLKITEVLEPDVRNSCYRIKANILYCTNLAGVMAKLNTIEDSITKSKLPGNPNYALLYLYRPEVPDGYLREYNIHLNDSIIWRVKNNSRFEIKLQKKGINALWAETEARDSVLIDVRFGEEYFLKCTLKMGVIIGRPDMELISKEQGRYEFEHTGKP